VRRTLSYDPGGRITAYTHTITHAITHTAGPTANSGSRSGSAADSSLDQRFAYDELNRLVSAGQHSSSVLYRYDANGNRTARVINGSTYVNAIAPGSNQIKMCCWQIARLLAAVFFNVVNQTVGSCETGAVRFDDL